MADRITRVNQNHAAEFVELWESTFKQAYSDMHSPDNIEQYCKAKFTINNALDTLAEKNTVCAFYRRNEKPIGFYILVHHECPFPLAGKSSELKEIYILADAYGSGVGQAMLEDACKVAGSVDAKWIWLAVADQNIRAQSFYDKAGFTKVGPGPIFELGADRLTSTIVTRQI